MSTTANTNAQSQVPEGTTAHKAQQVANECYVKVQEVTSDTIANATALKDAAFVNMGEAQDYVAATAETQLKNVN